MGSAFPISTFRIYKDCGYGKPVRKRALRHFHTSRNGGAPQRNKTRSPLGTAVKLPL
jgi:hypothetical protein